MDGGHGESVFDNGVSFQMLVDMGVNGPGVVMTTLGNEERRGSV